MDYLIQAYELAALLQYQPAPIYVDNQGAIALMKIPTNHTRARHIDTVHHFMRERVSRGELAVEYCPTKTMLADAMTKALPRSRHNECCTEMRVTSC